MANRKKPDDQKMDKPVMIRVPAPLKAALDKLAIETGVSTSERARRCLEQVVAEHKKQST